MAKFHGKTNLHLGEPTWAGSEYDHDAHAYVIELSSADAARFRVVAADYGFVEVDAPVAKVESKTPAKTPAKAPKSA